MKWGLVQVERSEICRRIKKKDGILIMETKVAILGLAADRREREGKRDLWRIRRGTRT